MSLNSLITHRLRKSLVQGQASRLYQGFIYPHSFQGVNNAFNNRPQKNEYPLIPRTFQPGEQAPSAHQNKRVFPDWYKPYLANYNSEGYFAVGILGILLFGYSYTNDIKEQKGRKQRKVWDRGDLTVRKLRQDSYAKERLAKGDPQFTKFLELKERAHPHH